MARLYEGKRANGHLRAAIKQINDKQYAKALDSIKRAYTWTEVLANQLALPLLSEDRINKHSQERKNLAWQSKNRT